MNVFPEVLTILTPIFTQGVQTPLVVTDLSGTHNLTGYTMPTVTYTLPSGVAQNWPCGPVTLIGNYTASIPVTPPGPFGSKPGPLIRWLLKLLFPEGVLRSSSGTLTGNLQNGTGGGYGFSATTVLVATPFQP